MSSQDETHIVRIFSREGEALLLLLLLMAAGMVSLCHQLTRLHGSTNYVLWSRVPKSPGFPF